MAGCRCLMRQLEATISSTGEIRSKIQAELPRWPLSSRPLRTDAPSQRSSRRHLSVADEGIFPGCDRGSGRGRSEI